MKTIKIAIMSSGLTYVYKDSTKREKGELNRKTFQKILAIFFEK